ncbi:MAG: hypothetical protein H6734_26660 [Alphaproteobacteria bacterium]|nr:hypothetical protein [Alphaproteobacteria bacterium]MCB9673081.1 hypothetical protein [Alphaproteobacteria bacterium]
MTRTTTSLLLLGLAGCGSQIGDEDAYGCVEVSRVDLAEGEVAPDHTEAASAVRARAAGVFTGTALATDDTELTVSPTGPAQLVHSEVEQPANGPQLDLACPDRVVFPATVALVVAGQVDETLDVEVEISSAGGASFSGTLALADVTGPITPDTDPATVDTVDLAISGTLDEDVWSGVVDWAYTRADTGDDGVATAWVEPAFTWVCGAP